MHCAMLFDRVRGEGMRCGVGGRGGGGYIPTSIKKKSNLRIWIVIMVWRLFVCLFIYLFTVFVL